jgi:lipoic acid synthetase
MIDALNLNNKPNNISSFINHDSSRQNIRKIGGCGAGKFNQNEGVSSFSKPDWFKKKVTITKNYLETLELVKDANLNTVCSEAACPNITECWSKKHMTAMILGDICTRSCGFCNVKSGIPKPGIDIDEPIRLANAISKLNLKHVVITSVDRDDLEDGGASQFANCIKEIRKICNKDLSIEILTPDFLRKPNAVNKIINEKPDVFNHNIETVPRLYRKIRPGSRYFNSLNLLHDVKQKDNSIFTKSGLMVGLGETDDEVIQVMDDLRSANVDFITIGQYLRPTKNHVPVMRYVEPDIFEYYKVLAYAKGFLMVASAPLVRSSYHADEDFWEMKRKRVNCI